MQIAIYNRTYKLLVQISSLCSYSQLLPNITANKPKQLTHVILSATGIILLLRLASSYTIISPAYSQLLSQNEQLSIIVGVSRSSIGLTVSYQQYVADQYSYMASQLAILPNRAKLCHYENGLQAVCSVNTRM